MLFRSGRKCLSCEKLQWPKRQHSWSVFTRYRSCKQILLDNRAQFTVKHFADSFLKKGINHVRTALWHPQSNGQAERYVDTIRKAIHKDMKSGKTLNVASKVHPIFGTPISTIGWASCDLLLNRKMRTILDVRNPSEVALFTAKERQTQNFAKRAKKRLFVRKQHVLVKDPQQQKTWLDSKKVDRTTGYDHVSGFHNGREWFLLTAVDMRVRFCQGNG